jgi:hypothetical protein
MTNKISEFKISPQMSNLELLNQLEKIRSESQENTVKLKNFIQELEEEITQQRNFGENI